MVIGKFEANNFIYKSISNDDITLVLYIDKKQSLYNDTLMVIPLWVSYWSYLW
jgi:hypothetical protein